MGEPIIIWPPDGYVDDPNDGYTSVCQEDLGGLAFDCTEQYLGGEGLACC
jgi:hypothetical protein